MEHEASTFSSFSIWYFSAILGPISVFSGFLPFLRILLPIPSMAIALGFSIAPGLCSIQPSAQAFVHNKR